MDQKENLITAFQERADMQTHIMFKDLRDHTSHKLLLVVHFLVRLLQTMPLAQGVIFFMAASVTLGTLAYSNLEIISQVTKGVSLVFVIGVGSLTLWLSHYDRRRTRNVVDVGVVMLMLTNALYLFKMDAYLFGLFHDVSAIILILALFFSVARSFYQRHPELRPPGDRRGKPSC